MASSEEVTLIENLADAVGKSAEFVTAEYAGWMVWSAVFWVALGLFICWGAMRLKFDDDSEVPEWGQMVIRGILIFIGGMFIATSAPDIAEPKAAAIHQLISDVKR